MDGRTDRRWTAIGRMLIVLVDFSVLGLSRSARDGDGEPDDHAHDGTIRHPGRVLEDGLL
jgi:hypothetical protein